MKILLLGKLGLLGSDFLSHLSGSGNFEVFALDYKELDITDYKKTEEIVTKIAPDFVINCAAYTEVDGCESNKELAMKVNGEAPANLASICKKLGAVILQISTDYVFDGSKIEGYKEDDKPSPTSVYGESKLLGEINVQKNTDKYYIVRISLLFGSHGNNFVKQMIELAKTKNELEVVDDFVSYPTYSEDLVQAIIKEFIDKRDLPFGIYHLTNIPAVSRYEFAKSIFKISGQKVNLKPVSADVFPRIAQRPSHSILLNTKIKPLRDFEEALKVYIGLNFKI